MELEANPLSKAVAMTACGAMAFLYVGILYSPTLILRLPHATTLNAFMIRRFVCATVSCVLSIIFCAFLLPMKNWEIGVYGIRADHLWQALLFPLSLTALVYAGSLVSKFNSFKSVSIAKDVLAWRNYVVAPITEELVFRACMIPLLLCGGFKTYTIIFFSPVFFSLAHLNHFLELYVEQNYSFVRASLLVGVQLGYTVMFGWYASFLFIRTGHIVAPTVAHIFCNIMGLPVMHSKRQATAFAAGMVCFLGLLFPATSPGMYNERTDDCRCWHGYCSWSGSLLVQ